MSTSGRWLVGAHAVLVAVTLGAGLWWRGSDDDDSGDGGDGLTLHLPDLRGDQPVKTRNFEGAVRTEFVGMADNESGTYLLDQRPAPDGRALQEAPEATRDELAGP